MSLKKIFGKSKAKQLQKTLENAQRVCGLTVFGTPQEREVLSSLIARVSKSAFGAEIIQDAAEAGYGVSFAFLGNTEGCCRPDDSRLFLSDDLSEDKMVSTFVHEARHAGQFVRGCQKSFIGIDARSTIVETRLTEADATACALAVCAELSAKGDTRPFGEMRRSYPNEAQAFASVYAQKGESGTSEAMTAAVTSWYDNEPLKILYERCYLVEPLAKDFKRAGNRPVPKAVPVEETVAAVCSFKGENYFSLPPSVLLSEKYAAVSSPTHEWMQKYSEGWEAFYNEKCRDESIPHLKEFYAQPLLLLQIDRTFGKMPVPVSERPEVLKIRMRRDKAFAKYFDKNKQKNDNLAVLIAADRERDGSR